MKSKNLIICFFLIFLFTLFVSCDNPVKTEMCKVYVDKTEHCTFELEKTEVPRYSFVKIKVIPEIDYYVKEIYSSDNNPYYSSNKDYYYKSQDENDTYFVFITKELSRIYITMSKKPTYRVFIDSNITHCKITSSTTQAYEGKTVTFTVTPSKCFYFKPSDVKVCYEYYDDKWKVDYLECIQNKTNPNEFSFIMPKDDVTISAEMKFGVTATPRKKEGFSLGEKIIFDIENHTPEDTFDLEYSDCYAYTNSKIHLASNVKLSDSYEFINTISDEEKTGNYKLYIYPANGSLAGCSTDFDIKVDNMPQGWKTIGIQRYSDFMYSNNDITFILSKEPGEVITVKYYLEKNNSSDRQEGSARLEYSGYNKKITFNGSLINDYKDEYDTITIWIEDENLKLISRKITASLYPHS